MEGAEVSSEAVGIRFLALGLQRSVGKKDATTHRIGFRSLGLGFRTLIDGLLAGGNPSFEPQAR